MDEGRDAAGDAVLADGEVASENGQVSPARVFANLAVAGDQARAESSRSRYDDAIRRIAVEGLGQTAAGQRDFRSQRRHRQAGDGESVADPLLAGGIELESPFGFE